MTTETTDPQTSGRALGRTARPPDQARTAPEDTAGAANGAAWLILEVLGLAGFRGLTSNVQRPRATGRRGRVGPAGAPIGSSCHLCYGD